MLQEVFPAVEAAEMAAKLDPLWWEGWQTLGRAQLNLGEVDLVSPAARGKNQQLKNGNKKKKWHSGQNTGSEGGTKTDFETLEKYRSTGPSGRSFSCL